MQTLSEIRQLLAERGLRPKHRFGQNFLHDKNQLAKLIGAAEIAPGDVVLEVGPGTGTLTEALLEHGAEVIACELDRDLAALVRDRLGDRITLIEGDCLEGERRLNRKIVSALAGRPFKLVANLPYQAASPLMGALLMDHPECAGVYVTIQKEVADRLLAPPGTKAYGPLTVIIRSLADVRKLAILKPTSFWPQPKVTSAMVAITPKPGSTPSHDFAKFITELFAKRRKQLGGIFAARGRTIQWPAGVSPEQRPESLDVDQLVALWQAARQ
ncbi:MAG TPA: 16S rRNA (adenine(1518)-N(6)/adenine(1519)-N(6))-dimethyltransferase RsmA [Phycisphaerales bacterium]|nr:16S rRNA (adenine(1518)-N(6)/adenine(1519)-N(6))-dimethyltransferase RsmA [Phycisphaerales bacterium]HRQ75521.1 16S rRNA (adenine(1518)-N(6)/adenine(1519)-N(6))-dimethyltransferase RsmA [Phycisphaerales bacterium]